MLKLSDRPLSDVVRAFTRRGIEAAYAVPTETALQKSIIDAHYDLRSFFRNSGVHDFDAQGQGTHNKIVSDAYFIETHQIAKIQISFYRPDTKAGDPRFWPYGLKGRLKAGNLIGFVTKGANLYLVNLSDTKNLNENLEFVGCLKIFLDSLAEEKSQPAKELLNLITNRAGNAWIKTLRAGPTGVGYTLETLLGIQANSSKAPDYKGIELKTGRVKGGASKTRHTLFSKTPDWKRSACSSGLELLDRYGYYIDGRLQLYSELTSKPNSLGHFIETRLDTDDLRSRHQRNTLTGQEVDEVLVWNLDVLRQCLLDKHRETFWISAQTRGSGKNEEFQFQKILHTRRPMVGNLINLIDRGVISLDYTLHVEHRRNGNRRARDHGYLFKIWPSDLEELFPPALRYDLI